MKKHAENSPQALHRGMIILLALLLAGCAAAPTPTAPAPASTSNPTLAPVPTLDEDLPGSLEVTLRIVRAGRVYPVVLGHDLGEAFFQATPRPELPDWYLHGRNILSSSLDWYGDLDQDGEYEYLVSYASRAAGCYTGVLAVDYDPEKDAYRIFDELAGPCAVIGALEDLNGDGIPEVHSKNTSLYSDLGGAGDGGLLSPIAIYRYDGKAFAAVTGEFPALVEEDIDHWLQLLGSGDISGQVDLLLAAILLDRIAMGEKEQGIDEFGDLCAQYAANHRRPAGWSCETLLDQIMTAVETP